MNGGRGFAHAALVIDNSDNHGFPLKICGC
jgi:hypothetical protein